MRKILEKFMQCWNAFIYVSYRSTERNVVALVGPDWGHERGPADILDEGLGGAWAEARVGSGWDPWWGPGWDLGGGLGRVGVVVLAPEGDRYNLIIVFIRRKVTKADGWELIYIICRVGARVICPFPSYWVWWHKCRQSRNNWLLLHRSTIFICSPSPVSCSCFFVVVL